MGEKVRLVSVAEMQAVEKQADAGGLSYAQMMENAGRGIAEVVQAAYSRKFQRILALVGSGNNGGDALVALTHLAAWGWQVQAVLLRPRQPDDPLVQRVRDAGGEVIGFPEFVQPASLHSQFAAAQVLLDGVLGTGFRLPLKPELAEPLEQIGELLRTLHPRPVVVAVDCPSGVDCVSGQAAVQTLKADLTVTMAAVKQGLMALPAFELAGEIRLVSIGDLAHLEAWQGIRRWVVDESWVKSVLPARPLDAHKGTFGTVMVAAGCLNYTGAAWLAGQAAYRSGAGLVTLAVPQSLHPILAGSFPEATWLPLTEEDGGMCAESAAELRAGLDRATALLVGPGMGMQKPAQDFMERLLPPADGEPAAKGIGFLSQGTRALPPKAQPPRTLPPMVVDADGLRLLARLKNWPARLPLDSILTPHPGEMSALCGLDKDAIQLARMAVAASFAQEWGHILVLKGAFSLVAAPDGTLAVIPAASPALARAGSGDVLAGLIAGLRAQGVPAFDAAAAGAWLHAQAGLKAASQLGSSATVMAGDILGQVPAVLAQFKYI
jgi:NAD(P)H-hydrate epimerase